MNVKVTETHERFITPFELCQHLAISRSTVARWIREGRIPVRKIGPKTIRILRSDPGVQALLATVSDQEN